MFSLESPIIDLQPDAKLNLGHLRVLWPLALRGESCAEKVGFHIPLEIGNKIEKSYHLGNFLRRELW